MVYASRQEGRLYVQRSVEPNIRLRNAWRWVGG